MSVEKKQSKSVDSAATEVVDNEEIFTTALFKPLYLTAGYIFALKLAAENMAKEVELMPVVSAEQPYVDPFKQVWWSAPICFTVLYLAMVFFGRKWMANRSEFQIKPFIFTYNVYQCLLNLWCVYAMLNEVYSNDHFQGNSFWRLWGNTVQPDKNGFRISFLVWVHYNNKYIELLDTVFMILRKKNDQVSFLHCYHHVLLIWAWFFVCKFESGGDCYFGAMVNSTIHVIMYGYYTLALLKIPCPWKQHITNCQMLQFCLVLTHSIYVAYRKNLPIELPLVQAFVMINMLVLFGQFYKKAYIKKGKDNSGKEDIVAKKGSKNN
jgi:elongation of very long chain fatty acids protein 4